MGERKGQNKYYPPDFDYRKHKSLDAYHGTHPLRERAKKIGEGILTIRFEMPYNIWCGGCGNHIGMGVRYNAEKSKIGNYYTTPIYKFRMKCHLCPNYMEIKTDPAAHDYVIISGARRKEQRWDPKENEQIVTDDKSMQKKLATDAMFRLEHSAEDQVKIKLAKPAIAQLTEIRESMRDDYLLNKLARDSFRAEKKMLKSEEDNDTDLLKKSSLDIELVQERPEDVRIAQLMKYRTVASFDEKLKKKREEIESRSIFASSATQSSPSATDSPASRAHKLANRLGIDKSKSMAFSTTVGGFRNPASKYKPSALAGVVKTPVKTSQQMSPEKTQSSENDNCSPCRDNHSEGGPLLQDKLSDSLDLNSLSSEQEISDETPNDSCGDSSKPNALSCLSVDYNSESSNNEDDST